MIESNLPSLPTFLGRSMLKSIDSKLWFDRLPSLPIFEGKSQDKICQYLLALLANHTLPRPCQQCRETGQKLFVRDELSFCASIEK